MARAQKGAEQLLAAAGLGEPAIGRVVQSIMDANESEMARNAPPAVAAAPVRPTEPPKAAPPVSAPAAAEPQVAEQEAPEVPERDVAPPAPPVTPTAADEAPAEPAEGGEPEQER